MVSTYSPGELSYLLAGRTTEQASVARATLGLEELHEGDVGVLTGAQNLVANGRAVVEDDLVKIGEEAKVVGYLLGTSTDWIRVSIQAENDAEGVSTIAMAFASSGEENSPGLVLRMLPLSNIEIAVLGPQTSAASAALALVKGYLDRYEIVTIAVQREVSGAGSEVGIIRTATEPLRIVRRIAVGDLADVRVPASEEATAEAFLDQVATLVGSA